MKVERKSRGKLWLCIGAIFVVVVALALAVRPRTTYSDLIIEELKRDASSTDWQNEYIASIGESNTILHFKFNEDPKVTEAKLMKLCKKYGWSSDTGTNFLRCEASRPGLTDWIYWSVNTKSVTLWDPSFKSSLGIHYRRSNFEEVKDYFRSFFHR